MIMIQMYAFSALIDKYEIIELWRLRTCPTSVLNFSEDATVIAQPILMTISVDFRDQSAVLLIALGLCWTLLRYLSIIAPFSA